MSGYVYDAGMLVTVDKGDRRLLALHTALLRQRVVPRVPAGVVGQAWRHPRRQVQLARLLVGCEVVPLDDAAARAAGLLCGQAGTSDVIDASVVLLAGERGDIVITTDPGDLSRLVDQLPTGSRRPILNPVG